ncbi:MAG: hypothetical protein K6G74_04525 [Bacilli bacterium]|nr:hypothetical protein [Bacilli bacterium]
MGTISLVTATFVCAAIGTQFTQRPIVKSDSYSLSQIRQVVLALNEKAKITGIEDLIPVTLKDGTDASLYDLNGDEGYLVLGDDFKIFDYRPNADLNKEAKECDLNYNPINRSFYSGNKQLNITTETQLGPNSCLRQNTIDDKGCGEIEADNLQDYVDEKFAGGTVDDEYSLPITRQSQMDLSVYWREKREDNVLKGYTSEGNCWLSASYTIFHYLVNTSQYKDSIFSLFPKEENKTIYYPNKQEPSAYKWVFDNLDHFRVFINPYGEFAAKEFDGLYIDLRKAGIDLDPSSPIKGLTTNQSVTQMEKVASSYGLSSFDASVETNYNAYTGTDDFKQFIKDGKPLFFASHGSTYDNHAMAVSGYKHYKRTVKVLFWDKIEWATFLEIGDGWSTSVRYFDITRYYWEGCGNAEFIKYTW